MFLISSIWEEVCTYCTLGAENATDDDNDEAGSDTNEEIELCSDFESEDETEPPASIFSCLHLCAAHVFQLALKDVMKMSSNIADEVRRAILE